MGDWEGRAACQGLEIDVFFGKENDYESSRRHRPLMSPSDIRRAKEICFTCEVRAECLEFALANRFEYGIWGGKTSAERSELLMPIDLSSPRDERRIGVAPAKPVPRKVTISKALREQGGYVDSLSQIPTTKSRNQEEREAQA